LGVPSETADGNDVTDVHAVAGRLVAKIRAGEGPQLLHALTWRVRGHVSVDTQGYRDPLDLQGAIDADPLRRARASALAAGVSAAALDAIDAEVQAEIEDAVAFANASPPPDPADAYTDIQTTGADAWL
jgi:pyruvate dehydrogenase E1 component alpha subunit